MNSKKSSNNNELDDVNYNPDSPANLLDNSNTSAQFQAQGLSLSTPPILSWSSEVSNIPSAVDNNGGSNSDISETFHNVSEPVDDYSLAYVVSLGIRYCANLKRSREGSSSGGGGGGVTLSEGTSIPPAPGNQLVNPLRPVLKGFSEIDGEHNGSRTGNSPFGGHHRAPLQHYQASPYPGNRQTFMQGKAGPHQGNGNAGGFNVTAQPVWGYDMETTKFQSNSSMANFLPNYSEQSEVKQVPMGEYWNALGCRNKGIFKAASTDHGLSRIYPRHSYDKKWQEILWCTPARDFDGTKALGFPGTGNYGLQTNNNINMPSSYGSTGGFQHTGQKQNSQMNQNYPNFPFEALEKICSQNSNFQAGLAASFTSGAGSGRGIGMETMLDINGEDFVSGIWEECGPLPLFGAKSGTAEAAMGIQEAMLNGAGNGLQTIESGADSNSSTVGIENKSSNSSQSLSSAGSQNSSFQTKPRFKYGDDQSVNEKTDGEGSKKLDDEEEDFVSGMLGEISGEVSATNGGGVIVDDESTPAKELTGIENCTEQKYPETKGKESFKAG